MSSSPRVVAEVLRAIAPAMKSCGVRWYLFGAQAAILWGSHRLSTDVDITVDSGVDGVEEVVAALRRHGFDPQSYDPTLIERYRVIGMDYRSNGMPVDVVIAGPGLEAEFLRRSVPIDVDGTVVPVISAEDLVIAKILAGRPTDILDVRAVIRAQQDTLDTDRIRDVLGLLEQALTRGDLLPVFENAWSNR